jgi:ParB family chromosome partitioning protein
VSVRHALGAALDWGDFEMSGANDAKSLKAIGQVKKIKIADIEIGKRLRAVDDVKVRQIAASISEDGLIYPITVRRISEGKYELVDGAYRFTGHKLLGLETIACFTPKLDKVDAQVLEVQSNLARADLTKAERIKFVGRFCELYALQNPDQGHGGDRRSDAFKWQTLPLENSDTQLAARMELSERTIRNAKKLYKALHPDALDLLAQGPLADNEAQIGEVSKLGPDQQVACAQALLDGTYETVRDWRISVGDLTEITEPTNRRDAWFSKTISQWGAGQKKWKRDFVRENHKELRALLAEIEPEGNG